MSSFLMNKLDIFTAFVEIKTIDNDSKNKYNGNNNNSIYTYSTLDFYYIRNM